MIDSEAVTSAVIAIDLLGVHARVVGGEESEPLHFDRVIPPGVLSSMADSSRRGLDCELHIPTEPRGTGLGWPPEARVDTSSSISRVPLAFCWDRLREEVETSSWNGHSPFPLTSPREAAQAVGAAIDHLAGLSSGTLPRSSRDQTLVVVVPNELSESTRQTILDSPALTRRDVRFLWRPVAAALEWLELEREPLELSVCTDQGHLGYLLSIHLGLEAWEATILELVRQDGRILPARQSPGAERPKVPRIPLLPLAGLRVLEKALVEINRGEATKNPGWLWHLLWCTPWSSLAIRNGSGSRRWPEELRSYLPSELLEEARESIGRGCLTSADPEAPFSTERLLGRSRCSSNLKAWKHLGDLPLLGAVVTGDLADVPVEGTPLGLRIAQHLGAKDRIRIEPTTDDGGGWLAEGARLYGNRRRAGEPTYLDSLPRLETLITRKGEPAWQALLQEGDAYVDGGRTFHRQEPLRGLAIPAGREDLELHVWHEEHRTVRRVIRAVPRQAEKKEPVSLEVSIDPDRGRAQIEVRPDDSSFLRGRRLRIDWSHAEDTRQTKEQVEQSLPRAFPPIEQRPASPEAWSRAKWAIRELDLTLLDQRGDSAWGRITEALKVKNRQPPVSTEGTHPYEQEILDRLVEMALEQSQATDASLRSQIERALSYSMSPDPRLNGWIDEILQQPAYRLTLHHNAPLQFCAFCARKPHAMRRVLEAVADELEEREAKRSRDLLRAASFLLMYRDSAASSLSRATAEKLAEWVSRVLWQEVRAQRLHYNFRYSSLSLVYLLRYRSEAEDFLSAGESVTERIRNCFELAREIVIEDRGKATWGSINPVQTIETMLDYLDRKGHGSLVGLDD